MTGVPATAVDQLLTGLAELRHAAGDPSYTTLVRQAAAQQPPVAISAQRLSDWFRGKAVPADPAVVRFLVEYLQPRAVRTGRYQLRPVGWWLDLHREAVRQRQVGADERRRTADRPLSPHRPGRPIDQCDPLALEVHPAIQVSGAGAPADLLPGYVPRAHDIRLREIADQVLGGGSSRLVTLVGGSSTGKTRACWELVQYLDRREPGRWWVWHPYDPTRPEAAVQTLAEVGPYTVVWLNEAQCYLMPADVGLGERIAAGLRSLLHDPARGPVLVLATVWPQYWSALTTRPEAGEPDPCAQARDLLTGTAITAPDAFTPSEMAGLDATEVDPRLWLAANDAEGGRITQYLAGAPELENRYRTAPPAAKAIIQVAMDARRLGHPLALPHALLEQAAPSYLDDHDWDSLGEDWLEQALAYTTRPCKGARGPLTRIRVRPSDPNPAGGQQPCYRLADYLEQNGRSHRAGVYPPDSLWSAFAATVTDSDLLAILGQRAEARGRYQHAIWLYTRAVDLGSVHALRALSMLREQAGDSVGAEALAHQAADRGSAQGLLGLARQRERAGDTEGAEALYRRAADRGNTHALLILAGQRKRAGDTEGAEALYRQAVDRGNTGGLIAMARRRKRAGDTEGAEALYRQAVDRGNIGGFVGLAELRVRAGDLKGAEALYRQAADRGNARGLMILAKLRERARDAAGAEALAVQAADRGNTRVLVTLAKRRADAGDVKGAKALYQQAADRGNTGALRILARQRERVGDAKGAEALYRQAADRGNTEMLLILASERKRVGDTKGAEALYRQAADRGNTSAVMILATMRERAGDAAGAEALAIQAADRGNNRVLILLAKLREQADAAGAEALYRQAVDRGHNGALAALVTQQARVGLAADAHRMQRFGLTGAGDVATGLDFGSYGNSIA
jgi:hypothetical protein